MGVPGLVGKLLACLIVLTVLLVLVVWGQSSIAGWRTWPFRLTHTVWSAINEPMGGRDVSVVLRSGQNPASTARACARAFGTALRNDGHLVRCRVFTSNAAAQATWASDGRIRCEVASAVIQIPYRRGGATLTETLPPSPASPCAHPSQETP